MMLHYNVKSYWRSRKQICKLSPVRNNGSGWLHPQEGIHRWHRRSLQGTNKAQLSTCKESYISPFIVNREMKITYPAAFSRVGQGQPSVSWDRISWKSRILTLLKKGRNSTSQLPKIQKLLPWDIFEPKQIRLLKVQALTDIVHAIPGNIMTQTKLKSNDLPVDSAERVHSRTAESRSFTVITNTDLLATWGLATFSPRNEINDDLTDIVLLAGLLEVELWERHLPPSLSFSVSLWSVGLCSHFYVLSWLLLLLTKKAIDPFHLIVLAFSFRCHNYSLYFVMMSLGHLPVPPALLLQHCHLHLS